MGRRPLGPASFTMKTYSPKPEHIERRWYVMDAGDQVLGRVATEAAVILRGKHKPIFAPHMDVGDHLIIINAAKVVLTGGKEKKKVAWRHSGHPGGITGTLYEDSACEEARVRGREGRSGHAPEEPSRAGDDQEAPRRSRPRASPPGAEARGLADRASAGLGRPSDARDAPANGKETSTKKAPPRGLTSRRRARRRQPRSRPRRSLPRRPGSQRRRGSPPRRRPTARKTTTAPSRPRQEARRPRSRRPPRRPTGEEARRQSTTKKKGT